MDVVDIVDIAGADDDDDDEVDVIAKSAMGVHTKPKGNSQEFSNPGPGGHFVEAKTGPS